MVITRRPRKVDRATLCRLIPRLFFAAVGSEPPFLLFLRRPDDSGRFLVVPVGWVAFDCIRFGDGGIAFVRCFSGMKPAVVRDAG